jgi:hypothetical protein
MWLQRRQGRALRLRRFVRLRPELPLRGQVRLLGGEVAARGFTGWSA